MYRGEYNKAKTVMFAYDDAIHGVRGKAADGRIFEVDCKDTALREVLAGKQCIYLERGQEKIFSYDLAERILKSVRRHKLQSIQTIHTTVSWYCAIPFLQSAT